MTDYDPINHAFTARQVIAGWIVCLGVVSLAIGLTAIHADDRAARAAATMPEYFAVPPPDPTIFRMPRRSIVV